MTDKAVTENDMDNTMNDGDTQDQPTGSVAANGGFSDKRGNNDWNTCIEGLKQITKQY